MNAITKAESPQKLMLLAYMADKYALQPDEFSKTVRATCGLATATAEQFAAFLIVAKEYDLNPLTKEIYAFPGKGGGIVPIVSIDGWVNLVNSHPQCDGFEFEKEVDDKGELFAYTCTMHRKDRKIPTAVTEYLSECIRNTEPWKMKNRMLRHKSLIQSARYAFGFAGIYDEDEGRVIADSDNGPTGPRDSAPPRTIKTIEHQPEEKTETAVEHIPDEPPIESAAVQPHDIVPETGMSYEGWATKYIAAIATSPDVTTVYKWIDLNAARLKKLEGSKEWAGKVKKATDATLAARRAIPDVDPITSGPQGSLLSDMGGEDAPKTGKPRGRPPKASKKPPDYAKDYDGWVKWNIEAIAAAKTAEEIEGLFVAIDENWLTLFPPDKTALSEARSLAEDKLSP